MANSFPTTPLYHYASPAEFKQILESKCVWLTPVDSPVDLDTALSYIKQVITTAYPGLPGDLFNLSMIGSFPEYSFSLTSQEDKAEEWAKYYPDGGFSIALDTGQLTTMMDACNLNLLQCLYDDDQKKNFIINAIVGTDPADYTYSIAQPNPTDCVLDPRHQMFAKDIKLINRNILNYAGLLKDASLADEQEWRIIASYVWSNILAGPTDIEPDPLSLEVKSGVQNNLPVTYLEAPLVNNPNKVTITQVVIGPNPDMTQAKLTCQSLVSESSDPGSVAIIASALPYRP